jgi:hypothetical protein
MEIRALAPIAKGSEIFFAYKEICSVRSARRQSLMNYAFDCRCEVCGLPDHLSDARDAKLKSANEAISFLWGICAGRRPLMGKPDVRHALQCVQTSFSFVTQERMFDEDEKQLMLPFFFFALLGLDKPMRDIGEVLHPILMHFWGPGHGFYSAKSLSRFLNDPRTIMQQEAFQRNALNGNHLTVLLALAGLDDLIQKTVSSVISSLRNLAWCNLSPLSYFRSGFSSSFCLDQP